MIGTLRQHRPLPRHAGAAEIALLAGYVEYPRDAVPLLETQRAIRIQRHPTGCLFFSPAPLKAC